MTSRVVLPEPRYAYCEPTTAWGGNPWHIRHRDPEEPLQPHGGIPGPALCGRDVSGGWDIVRVVTPDDVERLGAGDGVCGRCAERYADAAAPCGDELYHGGGVQ